MYVKQVTIIQLGIPVNYNLKMYKLLLTVVSVINYSVTGYIILLWWWSYILVIKETEISRKFIRLYRIY